MNTHQDKAFTASRLSSGPDARLTKYYQLPGLMREKRQFAYFTDIDLAHTVMLIEQGIVSRVDGAAILRGLMAIRELGPDRLPIDPAKGSLLLQVEAYLTEELGEGIAGRVHTGRSRIDQGATARRLYKRDGLLKVLAQLLTLQESLLRLATAHTRTIMPGYTHMQHAQPWIFGHYLLSFATKLREDFQRGTEVYARVNLNPLGTVGLSGTSWPIDRFRTMELLGFSGLLENSKLGREAYYAAETAAVLSYIMCDLNDLATDLHIWSTAEFGLVEVDDAYCSTSSIFPQKKNPTALESIKSAAGPAVTWLATALGTFRAEGTGDQAVRNVSLLDQAFETTTSMVDLMGGVLDTLVIHESRMKELLLDSWCTASELADKLVREADLSFRQAHHVVARLVRICTQQQIARKDVTLDILVQASEETLGRRVAITTAAIRESLDPENFVRTRISTGSVAPAEVDRMLASAIADLAAAKVWLSVEKDRLASAKSKLDSAVASIIA